MKILFDLTSIQPKNGIKTNGGGEYAFRIFSELITKRNLSQFIVALFSSQKGICEKAMNLCRQENIHYKYYKDFHEFSNIVQEGNYDTIFLPVCYPEYYKLQFPRNQRVVCVIHDLSSLYATVVERKSKAYMIRNIKNLMHHILVLTCGNKIIESERKKHNLLFHLTQNTEVLTVSHYSRNCIKYYLEADGDLKEITVLYTPSKISFRENRIDDTYLEALGITNRKYFLMINSSRWLKNNYIVIKALDKLFSSHKLRELENIKVVVAGTSKKYENYYKKKIRNRKKFIWIDFVSDEELEVLYREALAFVYPSLLEGFGMPPCEALKYETMCLCSTSTSIPEICGDSVIYFEPYDITSISIAILSVFDKEFVELYRKKIQKHNEELEQKQEKDLKIICDKIIGV